MASKITTDPHIFAYVNTECPDENYPKLNSYISQLILDNLGRSHPVMFNLVKPKTYFMHHQL